MTTDKIIAITADIFNKEVLEASIPVLVEFWAPWCGTCRAFTPVLEDMAKEYSSTMALKKVNVDQENELVSRFSIMTIPTLMLFKDGQSIGKQVGNRSRKELDEWIGSLLK